MEYARKDTFASCDLFASSRSLRRDVFIRFAAFPLFCFRTQRVIITGRSALPCFYAVLLCVVCCVAVVFGGGGGGLGVGVCGLRAARVQVKMYELERDVVREKERLKREMDGQLVELRTQMLSLAHSKLQSATKTT